MKKLTREAILASKDSKFEDVEVPEWGGHIRLTIMSGRARDEFMTANATNQSVGAFQARLLIATAQDTDGVPLFQADDIESLRDQNKDVLDRLSEICMRLNGIGGKAQKEIEKNSEAAPSGDSGSGSPSNTESQ